MSLIDQLKAAFLAPGRAMERANADRQRNLDSRTCPHCYGEKTVGNRLCEQCQAEDRCAP